MRAIGVDVGGTFTDLAHWDDARGALAVFKLPSVPHDSAVIPGRIWLGSRTR